VITSVLWCVASNTVVAALLAVAVFVLTKFWRSPHLAHALWLLVLIKLITPPIVDLPIRTPFMANDDASPQNEAITTVDGRTPILARATDRSSTPSQPTRSLSPTIDDTAGFPHEPTVWHRLLTAWHLWLLAAWVAGAVVFVGTSLRRHSQLRSLLAASQDPDDTLVRDAASLARRIGLVECPPLRMTAYHVCPFVNPGLRGPTIVLPSLLIAELNRDQVNSILAHELAHIRRRDHWVRIFEVYVLALNWWNPIAWWASRQLRQAEEECCDAWVIWALPEKRRAYGETLLHTVEYLTGQVAVATTAGTSFLSCQLERRIGVVMNQMVTRRLSRTHLAVTVVLGAAILPFGVVRGLSADLPGNEGGSLFSPSSADPGSMGIVSLDTQDCVGDDEIAEQPVPTSGETQSEIMRIRWLEERLAKARAQRDAVKAIERLGGQVRYDYQEDNREPSGNPSLRKSLGSHFFDRVACVDFADYTDIRKDVQDISFLCELHELRMLYLDGTAVKDISLLADKKELWFLSLGHTQVRDLSPLAKLPKLETISLDRTDVSDLSPLRGHKLKRIWLRGTKVSNISPLAGMDSLVFLDLYKTPVSDISALSSAHRLETLSLNWTEVADIRPLENLKNLKSLDIRRTKVTLECARELQEALPDCIIDGP
jgi:beta-lactamase regulating signal transducer with metallopeptidase domain